MIRAALSRTDTLGTQKREQRRERPFKTGEQTRELLAIPKGNIKAANIIQKEAFAEWDHCWNTDSEYKGSVSVFEWTLCLKIYYLRLALFANLAGVSLNSLSFSLSLSVSPSLDMWPVKAGSLMAAVTDISTNNHRVFFPLLSAAVYQSECPHYYLSIDRSISVKPSLCHCLSSCPLVWLLLRIVCIVICFTGPGFERFYMAAFWGGVELYVLSEHLFLMSANCHHLHGIFLK